MRTENWLDQRTSGVVVPASASLSDRREGGLSSLAWQDRLQCARLSLMCGISAIYRLDGAPADVVDIRQMSSAIRHRGPDGAAFARLADGALLLGHVRLSIVDLDHGAQ